MGDVHAPPDIGGTRAAVNTTVSGGLPVDGLSERTKLHPELELGATTLPVGIEYSGTDASVEIALAYPQRYSGDALPTVTVACAETLVDSEFIRHGGLAMFRFTL